MAVIGMLCEEGCPWCDLIDLVMPDPIKDNYYDWYKESDIVYRYRVLERALAFAQTIAGVEVTGTPTPVPTNPLFDDPVCPRCGHSTVTAKGVAGWFCTTCLYQTTTIGGHRAK
jgi:hypothetical protein